MQLTIPQRSVADTKSFPVDPEGVSRWLARLQPVKSLADAREVYRGLKHSNRLHNDADRRRAVLACFIPVLRELHTILMETCQAQPLPMARDFQRAGQLVDGLLREEVFAFKILLADSDKPMANDVRRAMHALARQAEAAIHGYRRIPAALLRDAHQLHELAGQHGLVDSAVNTDMPSTDHHYRYIMLLSLADSHQQRVRQLPLLLPFLQDLADALEVSGTPPECNLQPTDLAVHLRHGAPPQPAASLLVDNQQALRFLDLRPLLERIDAQISRTQAAHASLLGADSLEKQSLARLRLAMSRSRQRRGARIVTRQSQHVVFGHKAICAALNFSASKEPAANDILDEWVKFNECPQGVGLISENPRAGLVQVGELVSITDPSKSMSESNSGKMTKLIGVVRWVSMDNQATIRAGVELLATGVLPVAISRTDADDAVADTAMIIACKVHRNVMQTMLLPAYMYQSGDRLTASLHGKSRRVQLKQCLQTNGLFSHYSLDDA
jgi:hypothetical protein